MANFILCAVLFRIVLPTLIIISVGIRPCIISGIYLLLLLCSPFLRVPSTKSMAGSTGIYLKILMAASVVGVILQAAFQVVLVLLQPYGHFLVTCQIPETILTMAGFVRLDYVTSLIITTWIVPDILMMIATVGIFIFCQKLTAVNIETEQGELQHKMKSKRNIEFWLSLGKYISLILLCAAAVLQPSVPGGLYLLVLIGSGTWWACYKELERGFGLVCRIVAAFVFVHIVTIYAYQFVEVQKTFNTTIPYSKYFGLKALYNTSCESPRDIEWMAETWDVYVNPLVLIVLFFILVMVSKYLLKPELMRGVSPSQRFVSGSKKSRSIMLQQDSTGSVTITSEQPDDIPLEQIDLVEEEEDQPGCFENTVFIFESLLLFIIKTSYVATNIIMMAWSITFHSWLTFVLLLWANILWMMPNQRKSTMRSSPFLVFYATFLLISGYIYCMDIDELPSEVYGISLEQIGFNKFPNFPCNSLFVKCLYITMFWITLRQHMREIKEARQTTTLADMAAPLQVTVGAATGVSKEQEKESQVLKIIGEYLKEFLTRFWIWVVAITLFVVAITGDRMTGFRILYMALFLFYIIIFQLSFRMWLKVMFGFWLTVIIYSMIMLILVYTYQFDNFDTYWSQYLHVPEEQQLDIGLEIYGPAQLFVRLVTPTFFVIVTAIQLHYFHTDFMHIWTPSEHTDHNPTSEEESSVQGKVLEQSNDDMDKTDIDESLNIDLTEIGNVSSAHIKHKIVLLGRKLYKIVNFMFVFLEIHMLKFVLFMAMLMAIYDYCALYFIVVLLVVIGIPFSRKLHMFVVYSTSIYASVIILARMVYQIQYITHERWNVSCTINITDNVTLNNAEWIGFRKTVYGRELPQLVQWNIAYVVAVTLYTVVLIRQFNYKLMKGRPTTKLFFMFPGITRVDADKNFRTCLKYFANYGYYKFGVEISLIATVGLIGFRMDLYAILYAIWLIILFPLKRSVLFKVWNFYMGFIIIFIPIQYVMIIGLPPSLCIDFPWNDSPLLQKLQEWAFLMDYAYPPSATKLVFDSILLLFVARQSLAFRLEQRYKDQDYPGGSNESIIHEAEDNNFLIPVPDFITYTRSYLDVIKRVLLLGFMWLTLAIVFLAGANRVNIFSVGYLIGSYVFLWQGSDIYLKPIPKILKSWNWLLGYNVFVILCKTLLQMVGCVFLGDISECWVVQLLGIGCVRKFRPIPSNLEEHECEVPREYIGLVWDGVCFAFLIMQRRIFSSYNFFHMINETKATTILASRGAELIEQLREKRIREQDEQERRILEKIKAKMDRIKATQQKIQGPGFTTTENHYVDGLYPKSRPLYRKHHPQTYKQAVRSGDYYMFDELEDDEDLEMIEELRPEDEADLDEEEASRMASTKKRTLGQIEESSQPGEKQSRQDSKVRLVDLDPRPGTSKADDEISDLTEPRDSKCQKVLNVIVFIWACIDSLMVTLINYLNTYSRDYRYVVKVLGREKKVLKQTSEYTEGIRMGRNETWQPAASYHSLLQKSRSDRHMVIPKLEEYDTGELSSYDQPTIIRFGLSIWYILLSHSDILCYITIFLNQIKSATFLSLPLPFMVFLWGTLSIPRPSKNFWVTIIAYTQLIVLMKCIFQYQFLPWNRETYSAANPLNPARIFGIQRKEHYATWDLILLLIVFFHRYILKCLGLWRATVYVVPSFTEGEHMIDEGDVHPLKRTEKSPIADDSETVIDENQGETMHERKSSDLQRLVEENEEYTGLDNIVTVGLTETTPYEMFPDTFIMSVSKYFEGIRDFFIQLMDPTSRVAADVYSYMFMCDFFNFFVILIGYSSFGTQQGDGGVSSYLEDNRVPILFLLMLILQFTLILVDRAIFLRKNIVAKITFQFVQIVVLHIWLFVLYPLLTERNFNSVLPPQMYYMVKCFYLLLSAYQIRCGYPSRILGNFLCKGYNYANMLLFKCFMFIPFLFELRTVMDWMFTDTSMTVFDWIKMEDIFAHIFQLKCTRHMEDEYPQPRGARKSPSVKYLMGGFILLVIVAVIWFPLVFFSLGNAVGEPNPPYDVTLEVRIGPYEPVYHLSAQSNSIFQFEADEYKKLLSVYKTNKAASAFISNYEPPDIAAIKLSQDSANVWSISPPDRQRMIEEINSTNPISIRLQYIVSHGSHDKEISGVIREENSVIMSAELDDGKPNPERHLLLQMLMDTSNATKTSVLLGYILPKFLKVTNRGTAKPIPHMMKIIDEDGDSELLRELNLTLKRAPDTPEVEWWDIREICNDTNYKDILSQLSHQDCHQIVLYTFNDRIFPKTLNIITAGGIIGLYTTLVFVASRILRGFFSEICFKIMFEDMPNVDRVLQLCLDIYLVREAREFCLEEDLFAKLVFLFRSPETLIKWTRPKEELADDDDPEGEPQ